MNRILPIDLTGWPVAAAQTTAKGVGSSQPDGDAWRRQGLTTGESQAPTPETSPPPKVGPEPPKQETPDPPLESLLPQLEGVPVTPLEPALPDGAAAGTEGGDGSEIGTGENGAERPLVPRLPVLPRPTTPPGLPLEGRALEAGSPTPAIPAPIGRTPVEPTPADPAPIESTPIEDKTGVRAPSAPAPTAAGLTAPVRPGIGSPAPIAIEPVGPGNPPQRPAPPVETAPPPAPPRPIAGPESGIVDGPPVVDGPGDETAPVRPGLPRELPDPVGRTDGTLRPGPVSREPIEGGPERPQPQPRPPIVEKEVPPRPGPIDGRTEPRPGTGKPIGGEPLPAESRVQPDVKPFGNSKNDLIDEVLADRHPYARFLAADRAALERSGLRGRSDTTTTAGGSEKDRLAEAPRVQAAIRNYRSAQESPDPRSTVREIPGFAEGRRARRSASSRNESNSEVRRVRPAQPHTAEPRESNVAEVATRDTRAVVATNGAIDPRSSRTAPRSNGGDPTAATRAAGTLATEPGAATARTADGSARPIGIPHYADMAEAIVAQARQIGPNGRVEMRFTLDPEDLGPVRIRIETIGDESRVRIIASSAAAADSLGSSLPRLITQLQEAGFRDPQLQLQQQGTAAGQPDARQHEARARSERSTRTAVRVSGQAERAHAASASSSPSANGHLDLIA